MAASSWLCTCGGRWAFGLRAFDSPKPLTRMLPGSSPCELRLMLPDGEVGPEGFHDVIIENLAASPTWRSRHIAPGNVNSLRRRWPKVVFRTMRRRAKDVERLRRSAGILLGLSGADRLCLRCSYDECSTGVRTIVAVPGGMVCCLEGYCE